MANAPRKITPLRLAGFGLLLLGMVTSVPTSIGVFNKQSETFAFMLTLFIIGMIMFIAGVVILVITPRSRM